MTSPLWNFPNTPIVDEAKTGPNVGRPPRVWQHWFQQMTSLVFGLSESGTTAQRPISGLYVGRLYFDTTLNLPIWVKTVVPAVVWIDAAGGVV